MANKPKSIAQRKMLEARQHIKAKQYVEAQTILERLNDPTAKKWLSQIHKVWLEEVAQLIKAAKYEEALEILHNIHHPKAEQWINKVEKKMLNDDPFEDEVNDGEQKDTYHPDVDRPFDKKKAQSTPEIDWDELHRQRTGQSTASTTKKISKSSVSMSQREMAQMTSFTTKAIVVLILYFILWIPGLIANIVWHNEAKRMEKIAGQSLPGTGCLLWMQRLAFLSFVLAGIMIVLYFAVVVPSLQKTFMMSGLWEICYDATRSNYNANICYEWRDQMWEQHEDIIRACDKEWDSSVFSYSFQLCLEDNGIRYR